MKDVCILCDFDGTITEKDGLYGFFSAYASSNWLKIEKLWEEGEIDSKECLMREFAFIPNLDEQLVQNYINTIKTDKYFKEFYEIIRSKKIDLYIVSDGVDYFIERILKNNKITGITIISNHFDFINGKFLLTFPNDNLNCKKNSGTCKCSVLREMRKKYNRIIYIGDGVSDYCVCDKADKLYAKGSLSKFCEQNNIEHIKFSNFKDVLESCTAKCI